MFNTLRNIWVYNLSKPFIPFHGSDRNLDDVSNDHPAFAGDLSRIRWRPPGSAPDAALASAFSLPAIGRTGNLPRNAGRGPALFTFDLNLARDFRVSERARLRPTVEFGNLLNISLPPALFRHLTPR